MEMTPEIEQEIISRALKFREEVEKAAKENKLDTDSVAIQYLLGKVLALEYVIEHLVNKEIRTENHAKEMSEKLKNFRKEHSSKGRP